jgi:hypothetical protein
MWYCYKIHFKYFFRYQFANMTLSSAFLLNSGKGEGVKNGFYYVLSTMI